jgi:hypothetical protein
MMNIWVETQLRISATATVRIMIVLCRRSMKHAPADCRIHPVSQRSQLHLLTLLSAQGRVLGVAAVRRSLPRRQQSAHRDLQHRAEKVHLLPQSLRLRQRAHQCRQCELPACRGELPASVASQDF